MQVGILLYKNQVVGIIKFEAGKNDYDYDHYGLLRTGVESKGGKLCSYLFYPRPEVNPSRSAYDDYDFYPYDSRVPTNVHWNHGRPLRSRIWWSYKYSDYTYYELDDGTIAYTTNYELKNSFYFQYGYNPWTYADTCKILQHLKNEYDRMNPGFSLDLWLDLPIYILSSIWDNIYYIFFMIVLISLIIGGLTYFVSEFEIIRRRH